MSNRIQLAWAIFIMFALAALLLLGGAAALANAQPANADCPLMSHEPRPELTATVQRTDKGATITLTALKATDAAKVQQFAEAVAAHLEAGCKMHHPGVMPKGPAHKGPHHGAKP